MVRDDDAGGFPPQEQQPPGPTSRMDPPPDHGEDSYVGHERLTGMRALITGGDSGIGRAVAIADAREGADVAINDLPAERSDADTVKALIEAAGRRAVLVPGDLRTREPCRQVVEDSVGQLGGLDILVNNAGYHWAAAPKDSPAWIPTTWIGCCAQPPRRVLDVPGRPTTPAARRLHHQHQLGAGPPRARPPRRARTTGIGMA
jgi:hypothetical protein